MASLYASLEIGGVSIDMQTEASRLSIATPRLRRSTVRRASDATPLRLVTAAASKRALEIAAGGLYLPDLSLVDFTAPVLVQWIEKDSGGGTLHSMTILSDGPDLRQDVKRVASSWTLRGEEV